MKIIIIIIGIGLLGMGFYFSEMNNGYKEDIVEISNITENDSIKKNISKEDFVNNSISEFVNSSPTKNNSEILSRNSSQYWTPKIGDTFYIQLQGKINLDVNANIYEIDLFDTSKEIINKLHEKNKKVICYFSAGTYEDWREDSDEFSEDVLGNNLEDWSGEKWLDISNYMSFSNIMENRFDLAFEKSCDGVDPDNIDAYLNDNGFDLTYDNQIEYSRWLSSQAHERNLSIALKNNLDQIDKLVEVYDFAVNEQCFQYDECDYYKTFIDMGKPVFNIEYELGLKEFCLASKNTNLSSMKMNYELDGNFVEYCD